eukprot:768802-Hanusia_phi.AAC.22
MGSYMLCLNRRFWEQPGDEYFCAARANLGQLRVNTLNSTNYSSIMYVWIGLWEGRQAQEQEGGRGGGGGGGGGGRDRRRRRHKGAVAKRRWRGMTVEG